MPSGPTSAHALHDVLQAVKEANVPTLAQAWSKVMAADQPAPRSEGWHRRRRLRPVITTADRRVRDLARRVRTCSPACARAFLPSVLSPHLIQDVITGSYPRLLTLRTLARRSADPCKRVATPGPSAAVEGVAWRRVKAPPPADDVIVAALTGVAQSRNCPPC